jgi:hypothetical protein
MSEAADIYLELVKQHGMPESPTLMEMGGMWYETPEEVDTDADDPVGTAVFKPLPPDVAAGVMADYAADWAKSFFQGDLPADPIAKLKAIRDAAANR